MNNIEKEKAVFCWSGGKDSALALYYLLKNGKYQVEFLLTTVNSSLQRVSMHGVSLELLKAQAAEIGIPLDILFIPDPCRHEEYEKLMDGKMQQYSEKGIKTMIFGDIFLEDLKKFREENLKKAGMQAVFPLWKKDTSQLVNEFLDLGFGTFVCCASSELFSKDDCGRVLDRNFIENLPANVDPCGENGEFHTFVFEGPLFLNKLSIKVRDKVLKEYEFEVMENGVAVKNQKGFWFADLVLNAKEA
ncbi:MAG: diphthine--ammonia ligase [Cytophagaceae bacterium]